MAYCSKNSNIVLNTSVESGYLCIIAIYRKWHQLFPSFYNIGYKFVLHSLYYVDIRSFYSIYSELLLWREVCRGFSISIDMIMWVLSLILLMCCITFMDLYTLNHSFFPEVKNLIMVLDLFSVLLQGFFENFFHEFSLRKLFYDFILCVCPYLVLVSGFIRRVQ